VVAGVGGAEGEAAGAGAALRNDAVVVVEGLVDGDGDAEVWVRAKGVGGGVVLVGFVVACGDGLAGRDGGWWGWKGERGDGPTTRVSLGSSS